MRIDTLLESYKELVEDFGDPTRSMRERRKLLKRLVEIEKRLDKHYGVD